MDLENIEIKPVGMFCKKTDFLEPKTMKIVSLGVVPDNFREGKNKPVLGLEDKEGEQYKLDLNQTNLNSLARLYGKSFSEGWKNNLVKITAISEGVKDVEGTERECFVLEFEKA